MAARRRRVAKKRSPMAQLREAALSYPGAVEEFPWGESVVKVKGKVFVFLGREGEDAVGCSLKLPHSAELARTLPFCEPTGYGLGKAGWVTASFPGGKNVPLPLLLQWLDESYRAVAPKKLVATLPPRGP
ncbi:MAG: MmcQ/YjbR family DNA-binding protein [Myxococcota bacterium]